MTIGVITFDTAWNPNDICHTKRIAQGRFDSLLCCMRISVLTLEALTRRQDRAGSIDINRSTFEHEIMMPHRHMTPSRNRAGNCIIEHAWFVLVTPSIEAKRMSSDTARWVRNKDWPEVSNPTVVRGNAALANFTNFNNFRQLRAPRFPLALGFIQATWPCFMIVRMNQPHAGLLFPFCRHTKSLLCRRAFQSNFTFYRI